MKYRLLFVWLLVSGNGWSQSMRLYPATFIQFSDQYAFDNPAAGSLNHRRDFKLLNSFYTGLLKNVGLYYLDISIQTGDDRKPRHSPGLIVHSEYETELLKRSRVYCRYAWQASLSEDTRLSAGASVGFFNYSVQGTNSSGGTSVFVPDGTLGLWLQKKYVNLGISYNQVAGTEMRPVNRRYVLGKYFTLLSDYRFIVSKDLQLLLAVRGFAGEENYKGVSAAATCYISEHFKAGVFLHVARGAGFTLGLDQFRVLSLNGDLSFSYFQPTSSLHVLNSNRIELMIRVYTKAEQK